MFSQFGGDTKQRKQINKEKIYIGDSVKAPLYQQVFRWFREKIIFRIGEYRTKTGERFTIVTINDANFKEEYLTYEEAELECLKKLIEIVKTKETC